ncbi:MAG: amidohydrolase, partial [Myxococcota bacterium]
VWAKAVELGVPLSIHSMGMGWGSRRSISNYVYNHIGHFAAAMEASAKSLFLGGVTRRFPDLRIGFLEGGVQWAVSLFADLVGHWEKRNIEAVQAYNPERLDGAAVLSLIMTHGAELLSRIEDPSRLQEEFDELRGVLSGKQDPMDDFAHVGIERPEQIRDLFIPNFYFGCEADDPMTSTAFNTKANPFGAQLNAIFSSDIGHWDVPDMTQVLAEAYEAVEHGWLTSSAFRDFVFTNVARFCTDANPAFFEGTTVAGDVLALTESASTEARPAASHQRLDP